MSNEFIQLRSLCKSYYKGKQKIDVFKDLNLTINKGEFVSIMGPSGSGKTTLLNILGGLDKPTTGTAVIDGNQISIMSQGKLSKWRSKNVGFVFQFFNLIQILSAQENVEFPLLLTGLSASARKSHAVTALEIVGLKDYVKNKPKELSGGQEQRVAIARAIVTDPSILVCDEPTGNLDRNSAKEIMELLVALNQRQGKTIIVVTHDPKVAELASKRLVFDNGELRTDIGEAVA